MKIEFVDDAGLKIGELEPLTVPVISEELNAGYTTGFTISGEDRNQPGGWFRYAKIDGQLFRVYGKDPSRSVGQEEIGLHYEHISYGLIEKKDYTEEYEDTAAGMIAGMFQGITGFYPGTIAVTEVKYYKPSDNSIRKRLIDIANLFGLELIWDNRVFHMVERRGADNGFIARVGDNVISHDGDASLDRAENNLYTEGYSVDVIGDVALGDTVTLIDEGLGINYTNRVVSLEYAINKPEIKKIRVGRPQRDYTDYVKPEEEAEEEDLEKYDWLREFKIGDKDCLALPGVDITEAYRKSIKDETALNVQAKVFVSDIKTLKGLQLIKSQEFQRFRFTVIEDGVIIPDSEFDTIGSRFFPQKDFSELLIIMTKDQFVDKPRIDQDMKVYGVKFAIDVALPDEMGTLEDYLAELKMGTENILFTAQADITDQIRKALRHGSPMPSPSATIYAPDLETLEGLIAQKTNAKKGHHVTVFEDGVRLSDAELNGKFPKRECSEITAVVSDKPYDELTFADDFKGYGARVCVDPSLEQPGVSGDYVMEFVTAPYSAGAVYEFSKPYPSVVSALAGYMGSTGGDDLYCEPLKNAEGLFFGLALHTQYSVSPGAEVTIQAICSMKAEGGGSLV